MEMKVLVELNVTKYDDVELTLHHENSHAVTCIRLAVRARGESAVAMVQQCLES